MLDSSLFLLKPGERRTLLAVLSLQVARWTWLWARVIKRYLELRRMRHKLAEAKRELERLRRDRAQARQARLRP